MAVRRSVLALCTLAFLALSGCSDDAPAVDEADPMPAPAPAAMEVLSGSSDFGWDVAVGVPTTGIDSQVGSSNAMTIDVPEGAKRLTVNATWSCAALPCDLHFYLDAPRTGPPGLPLTGEHAAHDMGGGPLTLTVEDPMPGQWWAAVHADTPNAMLAGTFAFELAVAL